MLRLAHTSLRTRLIAAVVLTILPLMALIWYGARRQFVRETADLEQEVQRLTAFITSDVNSLLEATRRMLIAVDGISRTASPEAAQALLVDLAQRCPYYTSFGIVRAATASNRVVPAAPNTIDDRLVQRAIATRQMVIDRVGERVPGGKNLLAVAYCAGDGGTTNRPAVAYVLLDLEWLEELLTEERVKGHKSLFPSDMVLNILDRSGTILARHPSAGSWAGKRFPDSTVLHAIIQRGQGIADLAGVTGVRRLYAFQSVEAVSGDIIVSIGVSRETALAAARRDLQHNLLAVSATGLLLIVAAWIGAGMFIIRPVASLVDTTQQLGAGNLAARAGMMRGPREIRRLAQAFDQMAAMLQHDAQERVKMQVKLADYDRQLRSMAVETALAEERERRQIAAGLHDKVGPLLASCYMRLGRVLRDTTPERMASVLSEGRALIDQTLAELRSLTFDLCSPTLYALGLTAAVEELCREVARIHALTIVFRDQGAPRDLPNDQRVVLYRAARELLFNVIKHAEARHVTVTCGGDAEEVFVEVVDDGVGFDAAGVGRGFSRTGGFGLFNLHERLEHLGGRFAVDSSRGKGTRVIVGLPAISQDGQDEVTHGDPGLSN